MKNLVFCVMIHFCSTVMAADSVRDIKHGVLAYDTESTRYMRVRYSRCCDIHVYQDKPSGRFFGEYSLFLPVSIKRIPLHGRYLSKPLTPEEAALWWKTLEYRKAYGIYEYKIFGINGYSWYWNGY